MGYPVYKVEEIRKDDFKKNELIFLQRSTLKTK